MQFSQSDDQILSLIPQSSDAEFVVKNKTQIAEVSALNKQLMDSVDPDKLRKTIRDAYEKCMMNDNISSFVNIFNKQVSKEEEFEKLLAQYKKDLAPVEKAVSST